MKKLVAALAIALVACGGNVQLETSISPAPAPAATTTTTTPSGIPVIYVNGQAQHISVHNFWTQPGWSLGTGFRWEAIAMGDPWNPSGYLFADGYGGGHAILFSGSSGNIMFNQGTANELIISFASLDLPPNGIFSHVQLAIQNDAYGFPSIVVRENGVPVSRTFIPRGAQRTVAGAGAGTLFVGGSDHSNFVGWIHSIRGWDTVSAMDAVPSQAMIPARYFDNIGPSGEPADLLMSFQQPMIGTYADLSSGYDSNGSQPRRTTHPGVPYTGLDYADVYWNPPVPPSQMPQVKYVTNTPMDATYNEASTTNLAALKRGCTKATPPAGALIFDSFCRADQEFFHSQQPDLGSVEVNTLGTDSRWQTGSSTGSYPSLPAAGNGQKYAVGIYNRSPVVLDYMPVDTWVDAASGDRTVTVTRRPHNYTSSDGSVGISFRVVDESHLWYCFFQNAQAGDGTIVDKRFYLMRADGYGYPALILTGDIPPALEDFSQLSVSAHGSSITCSADGVPVVSVTDSTYATATGFGLHLTSALGRHYNVAISN